MSSLNSYEEIDLRIDFRKYWRIFKRRWFPGACVFGTVVSLSVLAALSETPTYRAGGRVLVKEPSASLLTGIDPTTENQLEPLGEESDALVTELEVLRSYPVAEATARAIALENPTYQDIEPLEILENIEVDAVPASDVFIIAYESSDPELAAAVVNNAMEAYAERSVTTNRAEATAAREFLLKQLPESEANVDLAAANLADFKKRNNIINLPEEEIQSVRSIANVESLLADARTQLADATAQSAELQRQLGMGVETALAASALTQSPGVQEAFQQLRQVQAQIDLESARYSEQHPTIAMLKRQESASRERLQQRASQVAGARSAGISPSVLETSLTEQDLIAQLAQTEAQRRGLIQRVEELTAIEAASRAQASDFPELEKVQRELERQLTAAQTTYESLLLRLQEIQVIENQTIGNVRIIEEAQVPIEARTSKKLLVGMGLVSGLLLGLITIFILDLLDRSVRDAQHASELFDYPLLGLIPTHKGSNRVLLSSDASNRRPLGLAGIFAGSDTQPDYVHHTYSLLQRKIASLCSNQHPCIISITSSVASEGKSEVAANLAAFIAQEEQRVLLVDASLQGPGQHHVWGIQNLVGFSDVLTDQIDIATIVEETRPGLFVLPAGNKLQNSANVLSRKKLTEMIERIRHHYDVIIFDTAPLLNSVDSAVLDDVARGTLLVVQPRKLDIPIIDRASRILKQFDYNVLGIVANRVSAKDEMGQSFQSPPKAPQKQISYSEVSN